MNRLPWRLALALLLTAALFSFSCGDDDPSTSSGQANDGATGKEWTDPATGLIWQVTPPDEYMDWSGAKQYCLDLNLAGSDDWHLPTISELRSLIRGCAGTQSDGDCGVTDLCAAGSCQNEACYQCDYGEGPADGCYGPAELFDICEYCWSSTAVDSAPDRAWAVGFPGAFVYKPRIHYSFHARCVR